MRVIAGISAEDFSSVIGQWRIDGVVPTPVLKSAAGLLGTACRIAAGVQQRREQTKMELAAYNEAKKKDMEMQLALAQLAATSSSPTMAGTIGGRNVKLATCVDQANDMEATRMSPQDVTAAYERYKSCQGDVPRPEEDLTTEQLTGLKALFDSGQVPYVDLAVWGPYGRRIQKKLKLSGFIMGANGQLQHAQLFGPPCVEEWVKGFAVFKTGAIMLGELSPAVCDHWMKMIVDYTRRYGPSVWPMIYQAEVRARLEHLERVRRSGSAARDEAVAAAGTHPFDPKHPWEWSLRRCADDVQFWRRELEEPASLVRSHIASMGDHLEDDAKIARDSNHNNVPAKTPQGGGGGRLEAAPAGKRARLAPMDKTHNTDSSGNLTTNRRGIPLCGEFQNDQCSSRGNSTICPKDGSKVHQCAKCLSPAHGSVICSNKAARAPVIKRKGDGKGKGKKGGRYNG